MICFLGGVWDSPTGDKRYVHVILYDTAVDFKFYEHKIFANATWIINILWEHVPVCRGLYIVGHIHHTLYAGNERQDIWTNHERASIQDCEA